MRFLGLCFSAALLSPGRLASAENLLRNGSFELPFKVGTTPMLQGQEPMQYHWGDGKTMFISRQPTGTEARWVVGIHPGDAHVRWSADKQQARKCGGACGFTRRTSRSASSRARGSVCPPARAPSACGSGRRRPLAACASIACQTTPT